MKKGPVLKKIILLLLISVLFSTEGFSASKKKKEKKGVVTDTYTAPETPANEELLDSESVKLPSEAKKRTYFYKVDPEVLSLVEDGSPESLRSAMIKIRKNESEYTENERVLIAVAAEIMKVVWQSERVSWEVFAITDENPYTGAIESAKNGLYDSSTGNVDFLTIVLPSLVLVTSNISNQDILLESQKALDSAFKLNENSVLANYLAGILYERLGDYLKSENYYSKAYESASGTMEIGLAYSRLLNQNGKSQQATEILAKFSEIDSGNLNLLKQNAYVAFSLKDYAKAEEYVARVLQQTPNDLEFLLFRARIFIEKNDYIHAVTLLDMYARQNDTDLDYLILRARVQLDWSKNTDSASKTIEKALQLYPDDENALMIAARISSATDSPVAGKYADELASKVLEKNPQNKSALIYALDGLMQRENWQEAYDISNRLINSTDYTSEEVSRHVTICLKLKKKTEAMEIAKKACEKTPSDELILQSYILAYSETESRDQALKFINSMLDSSSAKMKSYLYYRRSFFQPSDDAVLADLRSSLIANPRNSESLFRLYEIYYEKKDYRKAQYYLKQVAALNPSDTEIKQLNEKLSSLIK